MYRYTTVTNVIWFTTTYQKPSSLAMALNPSHPKKLISSASHIEVAQMPKDYNGSNGSEGFYPMVDPDPQSTDCYLKLKLEIHTL